MFKVNISTLLRVLRWGHHFDNDTFVNFHDLLVVLITRYLHSEFNLIEKNYLVFVLQTEFYQHRGRNVKLRIDWWHLADVNFAIPLGPVIFVLIPITVSSGVASAIVVGTGQTCWPWLPVEVESSGCVSFFRRLVIRFIYSMVVHLCVQYPLIISPPIRLFFIP